MNVIFSRTDDLQASSTLEDLRVSGTTASAEVNLDLRFRQARTGQRASMGLKLRLTFLRDQDVWRLQRIERR